MANDTRGELLPEELERFVPLYMRLDEDMTQLHRNGFYSGTSLFVGAFGGFLGFSFAFGYGDGHGPNAYLAGASFMGMAICLGRWIYLMIQRRELGRELSRLSKLFMDAGYYPPYKGKVEPYKANSDWLARYTNLNKPF